MVGNLTDTLTIELKNKKPVELGDYTLAMLSVAKEFSRFVSEEGEPQPEGREIKLYINHVREGSIIAELVANAPAMFPVFLENGKALFEFAKFLKTAYEVLLGKSKEASVVDRRTLENLSQIVDPVCKDSGAQINISTTINNYAPVHIHMDSVESNAVQNMIRKQLSELKEPVTGEHMQVAMRLFQARDDATSKHGDRAIIESLSRGSVKLAFASDVMKKLVLHPDAGNPFEHYYIVDVVVETVEDKPVLYKVTQVHEGVHQPRILR